MKFISNEITGRYILPILLALFALSVAASSISAVMASSKPADIVEPIITVNGDGTPVKVNPMNAVRDDGFHGFVPLRAAVTEAKK